MPKRKIILLCLLFFSLFLFSFYFFIYPWWEKKKLEEERNIVLFLERVLRGKKWEKCVGDDEYYFALEKMKDYYDFSEKVEFSVVPSLSFCKVKFSSKEEKEETIEKIRDYLLTHGFIWVESGENISEEEREFLDTGEEIFIKREKVGEEEKDELFAILSFEGSFFYLNLSDVFPSKKVMKEMEKRYLKRHYTCYEKFNEKIIIAVNNFYKEQKGDKNIFWLDLGTGCGEGFYLKIVKIEEGKIKEILETSTPGFYCKELTEKNVPLELTGEEYYCWDEESNKDVKYKDYLQKIMKGN